MIVFWVLVAVAIGMTVAQDAAPGNALFHTGWYNALDAAAVVVAALQLRAIARAKSSRVTGLLFALLGCAVVVLTGVAAGLMGPDTHVVVGAPGASVHDPDAGGTFVFPFDAARRPIELRRGGKAVRIGSGRNYSGGFIFWTQDRTVVYVQAADARGNALTITQPSNASFLSPVLLMQQNTTIAGMPVRYDTFAVPALRLSVKAVLFTAQQTEQLRVAAQAQGRPAVLFAVSGANDRVVPGGIGIVPSGDKRKIGGIILSAQTGAYPAVTVASAPYLPILILGVVLTAAGIARGLIGSRVKNSP